MGILIKFRNVKLALCSDIHASIPRYTCFHHHGLGVVIGKGIVLGENVVIYQNVTIGGKDGGVPIIGDNVKIFPNSVMVGNITVGEKSIIGACSFVNKNVPPNCVVARVPAKIIKIFKKNIR